MPVYIMYEEITMGSKSRRYSVLGRPPKYEDARRVSLYLPGSVVSMVDREARAAGISRSEYVARRLSDE